MPAIITPTSILYMTTPRIKTIGALLVMLSATTYTQAQTTLFSHDFEDGTGQGVIVSEVLDTATYADASLSPTPLGDKFGVIYGEQSYTTTLSDTFAVGFTYDLSLDHFARLDLAVFGGEAITLEIGYDDSGFTALASQTFAATGTTPATLINRSISWEATVGHVALDESIVFRLTDPVSNSAPYQAGIDNITLTAIPEPGTYALIAGLLGLSSVMLRRRR